jgi:hypothetical protein
MTPRLKVNTWLMQEGSVTNVSHLGHGGKAVKAIKEAKLAN